MKKSIIFLSLLVTFSLSVISCNKNSDDNFLGTWNFNVLIENYKNDQKEEPDEWHNGTLTFYANGNVTMSENNEASEGTWTKSNTTITLDFNNMGGYNTLNIVTSSKTSQVWKLDVQETDEGDTYRMVLTYTLTR